MVCDQQLLGTKVDSPRIRYQIDATSYLDKITTLVNKKNVVEIIYWFQKSPPWNLSWDNKIKYKLDNKTLLIDRIILPQKFQTCVTGKSSLPEQYRTCLL